MSDRLHPTANVLPAWRDSIIFPVDEWTTLFDSIVGKRSVIVLEVREIDTIKRAVDNPEVLPCRVVLRDGKATVWIAREVHAASAFWSSRKRPDQAVAYRVLVELDLGISRDDVADVSRICVAGRSCIFVSTSHGKHIARACCAKHDLVIDDNSEVASRWESTSFSGRHR